MNIIAAFLTGFAVCLCLTPFNIALSKRLKAGQPILAYVDKHKSKSGTPTMGGISFVLSLFTAFIYVRTEIHLALVTSLVALGYGIIGFADDLIKVKFKTNQGLYPWQKIVAQLCIALIVSFSAYYGDVGSAIFLPFSTKTVELGAFALPFYVFMFLAFTNSVNLTDGLDGLAGSVTVIFLLFFSATVLLTGEVASRVNLVIACAALSGALVAFLMFNFGGASIFMGDTGSMALGGFIASATVFSGLALNVLLLGAAYIASSVSVIIQVAHYKRTKRRVFLMAPLHHHFELKGVSESKIVFVYSAITFVFGAITLLLFLIIG